MEMDIVQDASSGTQDAARAETPALTQQDLGPLGIWPATTREQVPETRALWAAAAAAKEEVYVPPKDAPLTYFRVETPLSDFTLEVKRAYVPDDPLYNQSLDITLISVSGDSIHCSAISNTAHLVTYGQHDGFELRTPTHTLRVIPVDATPEGWKYAGTERPVIFTYIDALTEQELVYKPQLFNRDFIALTCAVHLFRVDKHTHWIPEPEPLPEQATDADAMVLSEDVNQDGVHESKDAAA